ncbi:MAG: hypothetical protein NTY03_00420 [Candidatus Bathyarchaeota archaeon]|nr:hypothetical protein [Candidatus Bathyarchaeota archaeon]
MEFVKFVALIKYFVDTDSRLKQMKYVEERGGHDAAWHLPDGVKILESGIPLGGPYAMVIFYEAPDEKTAYEAFSEIWPYCIIERYLTTPCSWCDNAKKMQ